MSMFPEDDARRAAREAFAMAPELPKHLATKRSQFARWFMDTGQDIEMRKALKAAFDDEWDDAKTEDATRIREQYAEPAREAARAAAVEGGDALAAFDDWWLSEPRDDRGVRMAQAEYLLAWRDTIDPAGRPQTWAEWVEAARAAGVEAQANRGREMAASVVAFGLWFAEQRPSRGMKNALAQEFYAAWNAAEGKDQI